MDAATFYKMHIRPRLTLAQQRKLERRLYPLLCRGDLVRLAQAFGSDKEGGHHYAAHYQHHFDPFRKQRLNVLEIGIGGYEKPDRGGKSLRMWKAYFPNSRIFGIDIYDKSPHDEDRIKTFQGSQVDEAFLQGIIEEVGGVDIIIDDGSHLNAHVIKSFNILFPLLNPGGIYAVEDLQTSYWEEARGKQWDGSTDLNASHTSMNFFKRLVDGLNHTEFMIDDYQPTYFDQHIAAMHFYHNLVFVYKSGVLTHDGQQIPVKEEVVLTALP